MRILLSIILLIGSLTLQADKFSFTAEVDMTEITTEDYLTYSLVMKGEKASDILMPKFDDHWDIMSGPNSSESHRIINRKKESEYKYIYVLRAKKPGTYTLGAAKGKQRGKERSTEPIKIVVSKPSKKDEAKKGEAGSIDDLVFLKIEIDTSTIYEGQQLTAVYKLFTALPIQNYSISSTPALNGFWVHNLAEGKRNEQYTEFIKGNMYRVVELKKVALFPQFSGTLTLDAMEIDGIIQVKSADYKKHEDIFSEFFGKDPIFNRSIIGAYKNIQRKIKTDEVEVLVLPLPNQPDSIKQFNGGVGVINVGARLDKRSVKANEPVTLSLTLNGSGNFKTLDEPVINVPSQMEVYDPQITERIEQVENTVRGIKKYDYLIFPRKEGRHTIPTVEFSYFDVELGQYIKREAGPFTIYVQPGDPSKTANNATVEKEVLREMVEETTLITPGKSFIMNPIFAGLAVSPFLLLSMFGLFYRKREEKLGDEDLQKKIKANAVAVKRMTKAKSHMKAGEEREFYDEVIHSIWEYLNSKFGIEHSEMSKQNIRSSLIKNRIKLSSTENLLETIQQCEIALFAPSSDINMEGIYDKTVRIIGDIEDNVKENLKSDSSA